MGTTFSVKVPRLPPSLEGDRLKEEIDGLLEEINSIMSTYQADSELSILNRNRSQDWISVSPRLGDVLHEALRISALSEGAFDITVGPLVNLWGFGPGENQQAVPESSRIRDLLANSGYQQIRLNPQKNALRKSNPNILIDLSALAKGYAVDQVADLLSTHGIHDYLVEVGGELRVAGSKTNGQPWKIAIEKPEAGKRLIDRTIELRNVAVATSGDYRNFFEIEGIRYSHAIDPRNGMPIRHSLASVTVLTDSSMKADAWATALMVLGPEKGPELAQAQKIAALFIVKDGAEFVDRSTAEFRMVSK